MPRPARQLLTVQGLTGRVGRVLPIQPASVEGHLCACTCWLGGARTGVMDSGSDDEVVFHCISIILQRLSDLGCSFGTFLFR